jgi:hypothetical protein
MNNKMNKQDKKTKKISNSQTDRISVNSDAVCLAVFIFWFLLVCALLPFVACLPLSALLSPAYHLLLPVLLLLLVAVAVACYLLACLLAVACCLLCCFACCVACLLVCLPACCCVVLGGNSWGLKFRPQ